MKKFVIISIILLLIGGGVFAYSLKHYIDVKLPAGGYVSTRRTPNDRGNETPRPRQRPTIRLSGYTPRQKPLEQSDVFSRTTTRQRRLSKI